MAFQDDGNPSVRDPEDAMAQALERCRRVGYQPSNIGDGATIAPMMRRLDPAPAAGANVAIEAAAGGGQAAVVA